jgi:hypothetical protein
MTASYSPPGFQHYKIKVARSTPTPSVNTSPSLNTPTENMEDGVSVCGKKFFWRIFTETGAHEVKTVNVHSCTRACQLLNEVYFIEIRPILRQILAYSSSSDIRKWIH